MSSSMIALAASAALLGGGGGSDAIVPDYLDEVTFEEAGDTPSVLTSDDKARIGVYEDLGMDATEARDWFLGEDNRYWGLTDVMESFPSIVSGYTISPDGITVWVTSLVKSGGIPALLDEYDVEASVQLIDEDVDTSQLAFEIVNLNIADYPMATVSNDGETLVVTASSEEAAEAGPVIFGTMIDGVELSFEYQD